MNSTHVIMPIKGFVKLDARFDALLNYLSAQGTIVHLVCTSDAQPTIYDDGVKIRAQQEQVGRMSQYLKFEMLDHLAMSIQEDFPAIGFEYHVSADPLSRVISNLRDEFDAQFIIIDRQDLEAYMGRENNAELQYLVTMTDMPIWCVGPDDHQRGDVMVGIDLPTHSHPIDTLNRSLIQSAAQFAKLFQSDVHVVHSWQLSGEQFMRQWLQLSDIDVARFLRIEKQQRESRLLEYIDDTPRNEATFHINVVEGAADITLPQLSELKDIQMLVLGHNQNPYGPMGHITSEVITQVECDLLILPQTNGSAFQANTLLTTTTPEPERQLG